MRSEFHEVVEVDSGDDLKQNYHSDTLRRDRGYAVDIGAGSWFFFSAYEPAYVFGRSARMSQQVGAWEIREAVSEAKLCPALRRDVRTLYVTRDGREKLRAGGFEVLTRFAHGVSEASSHWLGKSQKRSN